MTQTEINNLESKLADVTDLIDDLLYYQIALISEIYVMLEAQEHVI